MVFDNKTLTEIGYIIKPFRVKGELSISLFDNIQIDKLDTKVPVFVLINELPVPFFIEEIHKKHNCVLKLKNIDSEEDAKKFKNLPLLIFENDLPESSDDESFVDIDLTDYKVFDKKFGYIGKIERINFIPGNPVMEVSYKQKLIVLPFSENFIDKIDDEKQEVHLSSPEGLIELYINE